MQRELVAKDIFVFTSDLYAQVTAGAIITPVGAVVIDTLPFPQESRALVKFIESRHRIPVRYVINTHYHADHTYGSCFFENAQIISHYLCRDLLHTRGRAALTSARRRSREMAQITLKLPDIVFDKGVLRLKIGGYTIEMWHSPGHSPDSIVCHIKEEKILFAADTVMAVPFFADGTWSDYITSLERLVGQQFETIVQGHGEVILRGEAPIRIKEDLTYLRTLHQRVQEVIEAKGSLQEAHEHADIETCGKNRIMLNGLGLQLHEGNVAALYEALRTARQTEQIA
ncbi:MAG: MBL fold metallo-hydrolase [Chloroflexi bacterium]|nr:MBL fold metallo-hydrolase [Chloroflexota bacterium]